MNITNFTFTAKSEPECKTFLKIKKNGTYFTIDEFFKKFNSDSNEMLSDCFIWYRGIEKSHLQITDDYVAFSESLEFYDFQEPMLVLDKSIQAAIYFTKKSKDCLQFARFFTMQSALLLDIDYNSHWSQTYVPQYLFRCVNFGTASTWYSNCFDHILQITYWGLNLYTTAVDRDSNTYDETWNVKKTMGLCTYEFVVGELKARGLTDIRKKLTSCSGKIEEVRMWANYIKHKGGIDYRYLEAENPYQIFLMPVEEAQSTTPSSHICDKFKMPDERFKISDFKSPVEIDIDEKLPVLKAAHTAIHKCLGEIVKAIGFNKYSI